MRQVNYQDCTGVLDLVTKIHRLPDQRQAPKILLPQLLKLIPCDFGGCHRGHIKEQTIEPYYEPEVPDYPCLNHKFWELEGSHPLHGWLRENPNQAWKASDLVSQKSFRQTDFFDALYRPLGIQYEMLALLPISKDKNSVIVVSLHRKHQDFTERERTVLNLLLPEVSKWQEQEQRALKFNQVTIENLKNLVQTQANWNLTPREIEVLYWLCQGKSNGEIGIILGISPRTAETHALNIYPKMGVENRLGALVELTRHY